MGKVLEFKVPLKRLAVFVPSNATPAERKRAIFNALSAFDSEEHADISKGKPPAPSIHRFTPKKK